MSALSDAAIHYRSFFRVLILTLFAFGSVAQVQSSPSQAAAGASSTPQICAACIRAHMDFLASDALQGRGSGTRDELIAATYIASELEQYGIEPAGDNGTFLQKATLVRRKLTVSPKLVFHGAERENMVWAHGKQMLVLYLGGANFSGPLQKMNLGMKPPPAVEKGAVVLLSGPEEKMRDAAYEFGRGGAAAVLIPASARLSSHWQEQGRKPPEEPEQVEGNEDSGVRAPVIAIKPEFVPRLEHLGDGTIVSMKSSARTAQKSFTWNVVGQIPGTDSGQQRSTILLTAHLDHLGIGPSVNGDNIYNGADDDASGTVAVLEFARVLALQGKPRRTITFALFGSEEKGGLGSTYFRAHPPTPLKDVAAYLEFEMIGRADPAVAAGTLWLTGWERSNLGPELAVHGARLVGDPHPNQHFFQRSDNYVFAKAGVVAQTISSYGLHKDYHQPSDDIAHLDFQHINQAIDSFLKPILWLANSDFVPHWNAGGQP
jgi:aminopeptidase YwaD